MGSKTSFVANDSVVESISLVTSQVLAAELLTCLHCSYLLTACYEYICFLTGRTLFLTEWIIDIFLDSRMLVHFIGTVTF